MRFGPCLSFPRSTPAEGGEDLSVLDKITLRPAVGHHPLCLFWIRPAFLHHLVHLLRLLAEPGRIMAIPSGKRRLITLG